MKYTVHFTDPLDNKTIAHVCEDRNAAAFIVTQKLFEVHYLCELRKQHLSVNGQPQPGDIALHAEVLIDGIVALVIDARPMLH